MKYPESGTLTSELYDYFKRYQLAHSGRSPSLRDCIQDRVGEKSRDGNPVTSTSVINYNLEKLTAAGLLDRQGGLYDTRRLGVSGGVFAIPANIMHELEPRDYLVFVIDEDPFDNNRRLDYARRTRLVEYLLSLSTLRVAMRERTDSGEIRVVTWQLNKTQSLIIDAVFPLADEQNYQHLEQIRLYLDVHQTEIAVVTNAMPMKLAAIGMGYGVFAIEDIETDIKHQENGQNEK